jgi:glycosyltransferase involved in cell wall biosynthesis
VMVSQALEAQPALSGADRTKGRKVLLFGSYAPSLINFRGPLIRALSDRGHQVFAAAPGIDEAIAEQVRALGGTPVTVRLGRASLNPLRSLATIRDFRGLMRQLRPEVVIAYTISPIVLGAAAAKSEGADRFVALVTGLGYAFTGGREPKRLLSRAAATLMYRRALRRADIVIFQNPDDRADFQRLRLLPPAVPTALINGSGVDIAHFAAAPVPTAPSFLMIGRFLKDKGIREFGMAASRLKRDFPRVDISLAGWLDHSPDAIDEAELESMEKAGVRLLGRLDDVRSAIAAASVYVLPSYREGTPRSVLEAMAMGRAIVTTDAPGCRETVIDGENGLLVPPRDADALYDAMRRLVEQPEMAARMGLRSRQIAEQKYDVRKVNHELIRHAGL